MKYPVIALTILAALACASAARADGAADDAAVRNRITCYPFGIDRIGRGDRDGGVAIWKDCFAQNFEFSAFIGRGDMSRGGLLLRCVDAGRELDYAPLTTGVRHGPRPPRLPPRAR